MNFVNPKGEVPATVVVPSKTRRRLFRKYVAFFAGVVCLALLANDLLEMRFLIGDYTGSSVSLQREQARAAASRIDQFVKDIEGQIRWTTQLPWTAATLDEWSLDAARLLRMAPAITEYIKVDANGREQLHVSRLAPDRIGSGIDYSRDPIVTAALAEGIHFGSVSFRRESEPYMTIAISSPGRDVSLAEVNLKFIWDIVSQIKVGQRGKAYVVDDRGRLIAHPDLSLVLRNTDVSRLRQVRAARAGEPLVPPEQEQAVDDLDGRKVLAASAPVLALNWLVFVELPRDEAFASLNAAIRRSGLFIVAALAIATLAGFLLARGMVGPIRTLQAGAARIGAGNFDQPIAIETGDELEALADQFNHMAAQLQESHANLQFKVERRTAELRAANHRLTSAGERLRRANAFKSEILGIVAHELRKPMAVFMGRAELLAQMINKTPLPRENLAVHVASIRDAGQRLVDMLHSLLADAMADAHEISLRHCAVNIPALINEVADASRPLADRKGQTLTTAAPVNLTVIADHDRLREAVDNLVSNAIKYSPRGGHVDLAAAHEGDYALIRVADSGPGLTADDMSRLFGRFQRLSAKPTGDESSTGLGLSIVKRIVDLHGGRIIAENSSHGAIFTISLRLSPDAAAMKHIEVASGLSFSLRTLDAPPQNAELASIGTILLIEDKIFVREAICELLRSEGMNVVTAATGQEALTLAADHDMRPALIVSDYNLGGKADGIESIEALRAAIGWKVPAIVLTGDIRTKVLKAIDTHDIGLVAKPFKNDEFLQLIRRLQARSEPEVDRRAGGQAIDT